MASRSRSIRWPRRPILPPTNFVDASGTLFDTTIKYDASFYRNLDRIVQSEPWLPRDRAMIDQLKTIGIEKGKPYNPDAKTEEALNAAAREAHAWLSDQYDQGFPVMNAGIRWFPAARADFAKSVQNGYADNDIYMVDVRGVSYTLGFTGIKRLGTAQFYLITSKDKDGNPFDGAGTYRLTVPPNAPVKQYWSATVYDRDTHALVRNMDRASVASITDGRREEPGRLGRRLFRAQGAGRQGEELGADRPEPRVRADVPALWAGEAAVRQELEAARRGEGGGRRVHGRGRRRVGRCNGPGYGR